MSLLKQKLSEVFPLQHKEISDFVKTHGDKKVSEVSLAQAYGGMRSVIGIACDTSEVPPDKGLIIRGIELRNLFDKSPEEIYWLLLTGVLPNSEELSDFHDDLVARDTVPDYVWNVIKAMPENAHPMAMLSNALLSMQQESIFAKRYEEGMNKNEYWDANLEDALNIMAKITVMAAGIYRIKFKKGDLIKSDRTLGWAENFAHMLGVSKDENKLKEFSDLMRLYMVIHSDHEGGNVSSFAAAIINSALSDLYYSLSSAFNGLAGPLHGLANQECLAWILDTMEQFGGNPTREQIAQYAWDTLHAGRVIPGYGHAVLRITDPRFEAFLEFGKKHISQDSVFKTVVHVFETVPEILKQVKKIKDPWPNVDAGSGALLYHYGLKEFSFYTVLFSVARVLGISAQSIVARAMGFPIIRPKSLPTEKFKKMLLH